MLLREFEVELLRERALPFEAFAGFRTLSLGALLELCCAYSAPTHAAPELRGLVHTLASRAPALRVALEVLHGGVANAPAHWDRPVWEVRLLSDAHEWLTGAGTDFEQRFSRSLVARGGLDQRAARQFSKALGEMTSNVIEHSGSGDGAPARALVAYQVDPNWLCFSVGDVGRGVLSSLRSNPAYAHLTTSREALNAAVRQQATRKTDQTEGRGFITIHRALASRNGLLRFRSGDATLSLDGSRTLPTWGETASAPMAGLQTTVVCDFSSAPAARPIP